MRLVAAAGEVHVGADRHRIGAVVACQPVGFVVVMHAHPVDRRADLRAQPFTHAIGESQCLVDARGTRVIQARGLHIVVGTSALPEVGTRPTVPADDTVTIEHASGTTITIDAQGAVSVTTKQKKITLGNGQVTLSLDGAAVKVQ